MVQDMLLKKALGTLQNVSAEYGVLIDTYDTACQLPEK